MVSLGREVRTLEGEWRTAREGEAVARAAQSHSEAVTGGALEQLSAEASAAKAIADERIAVVEGEAKWQRETLRGALDETRDQLETAQRELTAERSAVFSLKAMLMTADADVAAMRGAAAHYAALGGEEAGQLREAVSRAEVVKRDAVEAERRRCDAVLEESRTHFDGALARLRESSFAGQAKLTSQLAWMSDALDERTRELHAEREGFDVALAREREATAAAHEASRKVLKEVAERQAARHAAELSEQVGGPLGSGMEPEEGPQMSPAPGPSKMSPAPGPSNEPCPRALK